MNRYKEPVGRGRPHLPMGIYDRQYIRSGPGRGRGGAWGAGAGPSMRMWSVNTWLIVTCIAVFVIDGFLPTRLVPAAAPDLFEGISEVPRSAVRAGTPQQYAFARTDAAGNRLVVTGVGQPLHASKGGAQIGWQPVRQMRFLESFLFFSTQAGFFRVEFWRLIGFQFLHTHATISHLLFNMLGLFFFGPMVERHLGRKRYLAFYLLCGIFGALAYVTLNLGGLVASMFGVHRVPFLLFDSIYTPLIGASAGVFGVLMAGAFLAPNATVLLFFIIPMRLRTLAYVIVAVAFFTVLTGGDNAGGEAGHLGGALAGFYLIRHPRHLHGFFDIVGWADPTSHHYRGRGSPRGTGPRPRRGADHREIDRILDKINTAGLKSLTDREKRMLREASERE